MELYQAKEALIRLFGYGGEDLLDWGNSDTEVRDVLLEKFKTISRKNERAIEDLEIVLKYLQNQ